MCIRDSVVTKILLTVQIKSEQQVEAVTETLRSPENVQYHHDNYDEISGEESGRGNVHAEKHQPFVRNDEKIGRNQPCPCGSGKKYKQCHGKVK